MNRSQTNRSKRLPNVLQTVGEWNNLRTWPGFCRNSIGLVLVLFGRIKGHCVLSVPSVNLSWNASDAGTMSRDRGLWRRPRLVLASLDMKLQPLTSAAFTKPHSSLEDCC
eukprot:2992705-Amphidinium_carterae.1